MSSMFQAGFRKSSSAVGSLISVALVFGGSAAFAGGLAEFDATVTATPMLLGMFTGADLEQLEHATAADGASARVSAMMESVTPADQRAAARSEANFAAAGTNEDLFPHSARLLPLLTVRADAAPAAVLEPASFRAGRVLPVGVPRSAVR